MSEYNDVVYDEDEEMDDVEVSDTETESQDSRQRRLQRSEMPSEPAEESAAAAPGLTLNTAQVSDRLLVTSTEDIVQLIPSEARDALRLCLARSIDEKLHRSASPVLFERCFENFMSALPGLAKRHGHKEAQLQLLIMDLVVLYRDAGMHMLQNMQNRHRIYADTTQICLDRRNMSKRKTKGSGTANTALSKIMGFKTSSGYHCVLLLEQTLYDAIKPFIEPETTWMAFADMDTWKQIAVDNPVKAMNSVGFLSAASSKVDFNFNVTPRNLNMIKAFFRA